MILKHRAPFPLNVSRAFVITKDQMVTGNPILQLEVVQGRVKVLVQGHGIPQLKCGRNATLSLMGLSPAAHLVESLVSLPLLKVLLEELCSKGSKPKRKP